MNKLFRFISIYFILGCFYIFSNITPACGDTPVSGDIAADTTWTKANSPYIVTGTVQVLSGATLTIEPGVIIKFDSGTSLNISHQLIAIGTEQEIIKFTSNASTPAPGDWNGIGFVDGALDAEFDENGNYLSGNIMKYCIIEYANAGIRITSSSPYIAFNKLQNNIADSSDNPGAGISIKSSGSIIEHNEIENNSGFFGIIYCEQSSIKILNNKMTNNTKSSSNDHAAVSLNSCSSLIQNNEITNNSDSNGINAYMSSSEIKGNIIKDNGGYPIVIGSDSNVNVSWNELSPVEPFEHSVLINTTAPTTTTAIFHYNNIKGIKLVGYPTDVNATDNYWGTTDTSEIDAMIIDYYDDNTLGKVNYQPIRNESFKKVDFVASPLSGTSPLGVNFTNHSMGIINSLTWDFGDSGTSSEENPSHTYGSEGKFTVSLTINRPDGSEETETKSEYIIVNPVITATAGSGGNITPSGNVVVNYGTNQTFDITPNTGNHVEDVLVDGKSVGAVSTYTFNNVTTLHTISATFAINTYTLTVTYGPGGTVTPGTTVVNHGVNQTFSITPDTGYHVEDVLVDGVSVGVVDSYTFNNVTSNHTISVTFAINTYTVTILEGGEPLAGSVTPMERTVNHGTSATFTVTTNVAYTASVSEGTLEGTTWTIPNVTSTHTATVTFTIKTFTLTVTSNSGGTVTPGSMVVNYGTNQTFSITPETGYHVEKVLIDGASIGPVTSYPLNNVTANHTIEAVFAINTYTITVTSGSGGVGSGGGITPPGIVTVNHGANQTFSITPNTGYHIVNVLVDGAPVGAVVSYTFYNVTSNHAISAAFDINTYTLTVNSGPGGAVTPSSTVVNHGANQTFNITPNTGYHVADVLVDGASVGLVISYTFNNVTTNHTISATFAINTYTLTVTSGSGGTVAPGSIEVNHGANQTFTITPNPGYHVADVLVDGASVGAVASYPFNNVTANHTISATFAINTYTITVTSGPGGTVTPGSKVVNHGDSQTFSITPDTGYHLVDVLVDGVSVGMVTSYPFNKVTANHTIEATFVINSYTVSALVGGDPSGGSVTPLNRRVNHGDSATFTVTTNVGYTTSVSEGTLVGSTWTISNVTSAHNATVTFTINSYIVTALVSGEALGGSVTPVEKTVNHGSSATFTVTTNVGYMALVSEGTLVGSAWTIPNVTSTHNATVTFAIKPYTITVMAGSGGMITPGSTVMTHWDYQTFSITPNAGYHVVDVLVDGASVGVVTSYSFANVTANHTISATFAINTYTIAVTSGSGGKVTPDSMVVNHGANQTFSILPDPGYHLLDVVVDGVSVGMVTSHTFNNVTAHHTIEATFAINSYTVTASVGGEPLGGLVTPINRTVNHGDSAIFTVEINAGYTASVSEGTLLDSTWTVPDVTSTHTATVTFIIKTYTFTVTSGSGGTVTPGSTEVNHGANHTFSIIPDTGYHVLDVSVDGISVGAVASYSFNNVTSHHSIEATFAINSYNLMVTISGMGSGAVTSSLPGIDCGTDCTEDYNHGTPVTLTAIPSAGSAFTEWRGACIGLGPCIVTMDGAKVVTTIFTQIESFPFIDDFTTEKGWFGYESGAWERGPAVSGGGENGYPDPGEDYSPSDDNYILGFAMGEDYPNDLSEKSIISPAIDCTERDRVFLKFRRYLNVESSQPEPNVEGDHARIYVRTNGADWTQVWENPPIDLMDSQWVPVVLDISPIAANQATVFIKFTMGPTNSSRRFSGWKIDDLEVTSEAICPSEGTYGTEIEVTGNNFGTKKGKVLIGSKSLKVLDWTTGTSIKSLLKKVIEPKIYDVTIELKEGDSIIYEDAFIFRSAEIHSIEQGEGTADDEITIKGKFFGTKKGKVYLEYEDNGVPVRESCKVVSWEMNSTTNDSKIVFVVPNMPLEVFDLVVDPYRTLAEVEEEDGFEVKPPEIGSVDPGFGSVGEQITILGNYFGSGTGGKVYLGYESKGKPKKKSCAISSWGDNEIVFTVPKLPGGPYDVRVTNSVGSTTLSGGFVINE